MIGLGRYIPRIQRIAEQVDVEAFLAHVRAQLADFTVPQYVAVRSAVLPRNPGGKVLKPVLREETEWADARR